MTSAVTDTPAIRPRTTQTGDVVARLITLAFAASIILIVLGTLASGCAAKGGSLKESIQNRAAVHMEHDFSTSLDGWYGGPDWAKSWSRDAAGFVRAGQLALYRPSQQLSNYRFEFLGQISGRDIGWVFRAADLQNYYATQLTIVKPGPLPEMALVRM